MIQATYNKSGWTELHSCLFMDCFFLPTVKPAGESSDSQMAKYCKILPLLTGKPKHREGRESRLEQFLLLTSNWLLQPGNKYGELSWKQAQGSELTQNHQAENGSQEIFWSQASHVYALNVFIDVVVRTCMCGDQRTISLNPFSPSTIGVPGMELRQKGRLNSKCPYHKNQLTWSQFYCLCVQFVCMCICGGHRSMLTIP